MECDDGWADYAREAYTNVLALHGLVNDYTATAVNRYFERAECKSRNVIGVNAADMLLCNVAFGLPGSELVSFRLYGTVSYFQVGKCYLITINEEVDYGK